MDWAFNRSSILSFGTFFIKSVFIGVGPIALIVMPKLASSFAQTLVKLIIAALLAAYIASPSNCNGTAIVANLLF